jgi:hypothetical protein
VDFTWKYDDFSRNIVLIFSYKNSESVYFYFQCKYLIKMTINFLNSKLIGAIGSTPRQPVSKSVVVMKFNNPIWAAAPPPKQPI